MFAWNTCPSLLIYKISLLLGNRISAERFYDGMLELIKQLHFKLSNAILDSRDSAKFLAKGRMKPHFSCFNCFLCSPSSSHFFLLLNYPLEIFRCVISFFFSEHSSAINYLKLIFKECDRSLNFAYLLIADARMLMIYIVYVHIKLLTYYFTWNSVTFTQKIYLEFC